MEKFQIFDHFVNQPIIEICKVANFFKLEVLGIF